MPPQSSKSGSSKIPQFGNDELIILGSGGGRYHATRQYRSTGGLILRCMDGKIQCHIDPGPGAIRDLRTCHVKACATNYVFLTHAHTDHCMSIPIILEAMQDDLSYRNPKGLLIAPISYLLGESKLDPYYLKLIRRYIPVREKEHHVLQPGFEIRTTHTEHGPIQNVGYILDINMLLRLSSKDSTVETNRYRIAFTSDTAAFPEYVETYRGVDILVANILRPDSVLCRGHLTIDEFAPLLREIHPKICVLIHFGGVMDHPTKGNLVPTQMEKLQKMVGSDIKIIGGEDGLKIRFSDVIVPF